MSSEEVLLVATKQGRRPLVSFSLGGALRLMRRCFAVILATHVGVQLHNRAYPSLLSLAIGFKVGVILRFYIRRRYRQQSWMRRLQHTALAMPHDQWERLVAAAATDRRRKRRRSCGAARLATAGQSVDWLNRVLADVWRSCSPAFTTCLGSSLDGMLANAKPTFLASLAVHDLELADKAPRVVELDVVQATLSRLVLNMRVRFSGDELMLSFIGTFAAGGRLLGGMKGLKCEAWVRLELCRPPAAASDPPLGAPFFTALKVSLLQQLAPQFRVFLSSVMLPTALGTSISEGAIKPALVSMLQEHVFANIPVWPEGLLLPMGQSPRVQRSLPLLAYRLHAILAVQAFRAVNLRRPVSNAFVAASMDGCTWHRSGPALTPVAEAPDGSVEWGSELPTAGVSRSGVFAVPLPAHDISLRVCIAEPGRAREAARGIRLQDGSSAIIVARTTLPVQHLDEGEVLQGWVRLVDSDSELLQDPEDIEPTCREVPRSVWQRRTHLSRPRLVFDNYQRSICPLVGGEPERTLRKLRSQPLEFLHDRSTRMTPDEVEAGLRGPRDAAAAPEATAGTTEANPRSPLDALAPDGALRLRLCGLRSTQLQNIFGVGSRLHVRRQQSAEGTTACAADVNSHSLEAGGREEYGGSDAENVQLLNECFQPLVPDGWESSDQLGCVTVHVHDASRLAPWNPTTGHFWSMLELGGCDPFCTLSLKSAGTDAHPGTERRTKVVQDSLNALFDCRFEYPVVSVRQALVFTVYSQRDLRKARMQREIGVAEVHLQDLAARPGNDELGQARRVALDLHCPKDGCRHVVTGTLNVTLEWVPLNGGRVPAPTPHAHLLSRPPQRGSLYIRAVRAWGLPPMDAVQTTSNTHVQVISSAAESATARVAGLFPVWLDAHRLHDVRSDASVFVNVFHTPRSLVGSVPVALLDSQAQMLGSCKFSVGDVSCVPGEVVLVVKQLYLQPEGSDPGDARLPAGADTGDSSDDSSMDDAASSTTSTSEAASRFDVQVGTSSRLGQAGSVACERVPSPLTQSCGCIAVEVAYLPEDSAAGLDGFTWPDVDRVAIARDAEQLQSERVATLQRAHRPDALRQLRSTFRELYTSFMPLVATNAVAQPQASASVAQEAVTGQLTLRVLRVPGGARLSRYKKYVSVQHGGTTVGRTRRSLSCDFSCELEPLEAISVDEAIVFKLKGRSVYKFVLGQSQVLVKDLVCDVHSTCTDVGKQLALHGCNCNLQICYSWVPAALL